MLDTYQQKMMANAWTVDTINKSKWFQDIVKDACAPSRRDGNKIIVTFKTRDQAEQAIMKANARNISCSYNIYDIRRDEHYISIFMNWKEVRPSRLQRNKDLILD